MKKIVALLLIVSICMTSTVFASAKKAPTLDNEYIENLVRLVTARTGESDEKSFNPKSEIKFCLPMYGTDKEVDAYYIQLKAKGKESGYIIIGSNEEYPPIIEYGYGYTPFDGLKNNLSNNKLYILGIGEYGSEETKSPGNLKLLNSGKEVELANLKKIDTDIDYKKEWENMEIAVSGNSDSQAPTSGGVITDPSETGYQYFLSMNVVNYDQTYFKSSQLDPTQIRSDDCGSTVICNLFKYYEYNGYAIFGWQDYEDLHEDIYSDIGGGASLWEVDSAIQDFSYDVTGTEFNGNIDFFYSKSTLNNEIANDRPFIYLLQNHYYYKNHYVLCVGTENFLYSDGTDSLYLRIADGSSSSSADRFVHTEVGSTHNYIIRVNP